MADYERAIELDPRNLTLRVNLARTYGFLRNYQQSEQTVERALEIAPDNGLLYGAKAIIHVYRDGNVALLKEYGNRWLAALYERDYDTALSVLDSQEREVSTSGWSYTPKATSYGITYRLAGEHELAEQQFEVAREHVEAALEANPEDFRLYNALGMILAGLGESEEAVRMARQAIDDALPTSRDTYAHPLWQMQTILALAMAGDSDAAIEELDTYLGAPGRWSIEGLLPDPRLDLIRDDPRFDALVEKYRRR